MERCGIDDGQGACTLPGGHDGPHHAWRQREDLPAGRAGCMICGAAPDSLAVTVDLTFAAGPLGPRHTTHVPHRVTAWTLCSDCWRDDKLIVAVLGSGDLEPVLAPRSCTAFCSNSASRRPRRRRFWSPFQGARGEPADPRCPVCWGSCEVKTEGDQR